MFEKVRILNFWKRDSNKRRNWCRWIKEDMKMEKIGIGKEVRKGWGCLVGVFLLVVFASCGQSAPDLSGTYVRSASHEFGREWDTVVITDQGATYSIERRWRYNRVLDGRPLPTEYKVSRSVGKYDHSGLRDQESGLLLTGFDGGLRVGSVEYQKIK
jgi:hypothetical protein